MSITHTNANENANEMANTEVGISLPGFLQSLAAGGGFTTNGCIGEMIDNALDCPRTREIKIWARNKYFGFSNDGNGMTKAKLCWIQKMCRHKAARAGISGRFGFGYPAARDKFMGEKGRCDWVSLKENATVSSVDDLINETDKFNDDKHPDTLSHIGFKMEDLFAGNFSINSGHEELPTRVKNLYKECAVNPLKPNTMVSFEMSEKFKTYLQAQMTNNQLNIQNLKWYLLTTYHNSLKEGKKMELLGTDLVHIPSLEDYVTNESQACERKVPIKYDGMEAELMCKFNRSVNIIRHRIYKLEADKFEELKDKVEGDGKKNQKFDATSRTLPLIVEEIGSKSRNPLFMLAVKEGYENHAFGGGVYKQKIKGLNKKALKNIVKFHSKAVIGHKAVSTMNKEGYLEYIAASLAANGFDMPRNFPKSIFNNLLERAKKNIQIKNQDKNNKWNLCGMVGFNDVQNIYSLEASDRLFDKNIQQDLDKYYNLLDELMAILFDKSSIDYNNIDADIRTTFRYLEHHSNLDAFSKDVANDIASGKKTLKTVRELMKKDMLGGFTNYDRQLQYTDAFLQGIRVGDVNQENLTIAYINEENIILKDENDSAVGPFEYKDLIVAVEAYDTWRNQMDLGLNESSDAEEEEEEEAEAELEQITFQVGEEEEESDGGEYIPEEDEDEEGEEEDEEDEYNEEAARSPGSSHRREAAEVSNGFNYERTRSKLQELRDNVTSEEDQAACCLVLKQIRNQYVMKLLGRRDGPIIVKSLNRGTRSFEDYYLDVKEQLYEAQDEYGVDEAVMGGTRIHRLWDTYVNVDEA